MSLTLERQIDVDLSAERPSIDRRSDDRHKATYRPCCVIGEGRVTLGLIRNFSKNGARVEVQADFQPGDVIKYFWEADSCISARVVWCDGNAIGLEHLQRSRARSGRYPMRSVRVPCESEAQIWSGGCRYRAQIENISLGGMRLSGLPALKTGSLVSIQFCGLEFDAASVRWSDGLDTGVRFAKRMTRDDLAQLLLDERFGLASVDFAIGTEDETDTFRKGVA